MSERISLYLTEKELALLFFIMGYSFQSVPMTYADTFASLMDKLCEVSRQGQEEKEQ